MSNERLLEIIERQDKYYILGFIQGLKSNIEILEQENQKLKEKYNKALSIMANYSPPCEKNGFMDRNTDYCRMNCGVDEEIFKNCWDKYIEQELIK